MPSPLAQKQCRPCNADTPKLQGDALAAITTELGGDWAVQDGHHLFKEYPFPDFAEALAFTNRVGAVAEEQGHHPDIRLTWGKVTITIWTHAVDGLSESDFILAAKADAVR